MSGQKGNEEEEATKDAEEEEEQDEEEKNTETSPRPGGSTEQQPPEGDREPGGDREADWSATVKVVLVPEGHVMTVAFAVGLSVQELKRHLASELRVPAEVLQISVDGAVVDEQQSLMELGVRPHGSTRMEMRSTDPAAHPLRPLRPPEHDNTPDVLTVRVQTGEGVFQEAVVEIERPRRQKAFLGGYRHRLTGAEYHHAAVQTPPRRRPDRGAAALSRDSQTVELKPQAQQCPADVSTQVSGVGGVGCYVSRLRDRLVAPGNYTTADEYHDGRLRAVIRLQSYARRWLARQEVDRLRRQRDRRCAWLEVQERRRREEKEEQLRDRRRRCVSPRRREDFELLYHALEEWRSEEERRINSSLRGAERRAALCSLLEQETQYIATIGRQRIAARTKNHDETIRKFLDKSAAPRRWRAANGRLIEMDSQQTIRARELRDLYNDVGLSATSREARLHVLETLRRTVKEHECPLTRDILDLIGREVDLMSRDVKAARLEGLRKRISTLFLQYIKTPEFNPEVAKLLRVPQNPSQLKNNMFLCRGCRRYLLSSNFSPSTGTRLISWCHDCTGLDRIARSRDDSSWHTNILKRLRADEQRLNAGAQIPLLLQVEDMRFLVEVVWASRSALRASDDLCDLVFVRWERQREWSPWNCILLSKEEASAHMEVEDVHKTYEATFIRSIEAKHMLARRHFSRIPVMAQYLDAQLAAALGDWHVSKPVAMATDERATDTTPASAR